MIFSPIFNYLRSINEDPSDPIKKERMALQEELQRLQIENQLLNRELFHLQQLFGYQKKIDQKLNRLDSISSAETKFITEQYQNSLRRMVQNLNWQVRTLAARVIFRSFDQWNSAVWINVGAADNDSSDQPIVAKNSPVLIDQAIVGIIDYVGQHQSRVRLITDARITPSVRAIRGGEQEDLVADQIDLLQELLTPRMAASLTDQQYQSFKESLQSIRAKLQPMKKNWYLAKGELQGSIHPIGYGTPLLKGTGFNYDYPDEEGEARDLRTGQSTTNKNSAAIPILKTNDILVTTGMDGIFPSGLKVAIVTKIEVLREGDYYYDIQAKPLVKNLEEISLVFVIPPLRGIEEIVKN